VLRLKTITAWALLAGLVLVFFSPLVPLEATALRASRSASTLMSSMAATALAVAALSLPAIMVARVGFLAQPAPRTGSAIIDLECARLC
jgi:uncharacterized paraquat-inducible protein A